ncbi:TPA: hypothetical protein G9W68_004481 [Salmonella enterica subsp. enterica serovar Typhimurium]|nr:hypothetical protein [Salmonella enterica subsp. enterica serovar Typhimurium]HAG0027288.1 hypothetical protein [Salmonella enterica]
MGTTKDWVIQVEESRREEWIRERLSSPDLEEDSEEWQLLEKDYDEYQDFLSDMAMEEYETEKWLKQHPHTEIYKIAINLLEQIKEEGKQSTSEVFIKMKIAYIVLMNPLMILVKIIKLRWIHILSYDQMVSRKINNQTTRCANSIFYTTLFTNSAPNYT